MANGSPLSYWLTLTWDVLKSDTPTETNKEARRLTLTWDVLKFDQALSATNS